MIQYFHCKNEVEKKKFENIDWADSNIDKIEIEYDCAKLLIFNDTLQKKVCVSCTGFIGLTNLCIWDDQIIDSATVHQIQDNDDTPFIKMVFSAYDKDFDYGGKRLNKGILELRIKLVNGIAFSIYCQKIDVE